MTANDDERLLLFGLILRVTAASVLMIMMIVNFVLLSGLGSSKVKLIHLHLIVRNSFALFFISIYTNSNIANLGSNLLCVPQTRTQQ